MWYRPCGNRFSGSAVYPLQQNGDFSVCDLYILILEENPVFAQGLKCICTLLPSLSTSDRQSFILIKLFLSEADKLRIPIVLWQSHLKRGICLSQGPDIRVFQSSCTPFISRISPTLFELNKFYLLIPSSGGPARELPSQIITLYFSWMKLYKKPLSRLKFQNFMQ